MRRKLRRSIVVRLMTRLIDREADPNRHGTVMGQLDAIYMLADQQFYLSKIGPSWTGHKVNPGTIATLVHPLSSDSAFASWSFPVRN